MILAHEMERYFNRQYLQWEQIDVSDFWYGGTLPCLSLFETEGAGVRVLDVIKDFENSLEL